MTFVLTLHGDEIARGSWGRVMDEAVEHRLAGLEWLGRRGEPVPFWRLARGVAVTLVGRT